MSNPYYRCISISFTNIFNNETLCLSNYECHLLNSANYSLWPIDFYTSALSDNFKARLENARKINYNLPYLFKPVTIDKNIPIFDEKIRMLFASIACREPLPCYSEKIKIQLKITGLPKIAEINFIIVDSKIINKPILAPKDYKEFT